MNRPKDVPQRGKQRARPVGVEQTDGADITQSVFPAANHVRRQSWKLLGFCLAPRHEEGAHPLISGIRLSVRDERLHQLAVIGNRRFAQLIAGFGIPHIHPGRDDPGPGLGGVPFVHPVHQRHSLPGFHQRIGGAPAQQPAPDHDRVDF